MDIVVLIALMLVVATASIVIPLAVESSDRRRKYRSLLTKEEVDKALREGRTQTHSLRLKP